MRFRDKVIRFLSETTEQRAERKLGEVSRDLAEQQRYLGTTSDNDYTVGYKNFLRRKIQELETAKGKWSRIVDGYSAG